jgi:NADH:ubiquinone oxidoreductase subunit B-like Fe-S oxidoreductase
VVGHVDEVIPVDVYVPGCPPRPEAIIDGIIKLLQRLTPRTDPAAPVPEGGATNERQPKNATAAPGTTWM